MCIERITGDFERLPYMDNILIGIKQPDYIQKQILDCECHRSDRWSR